MGIVNEVIAGSRELNITHAPIDELGWPEMTMNFRLTDNVDLHGIAAGAKIHFVLVKDDTGRYRIDSVSVQE
jgi:Cu(I)/Ag(I) efflux system membrane fusion protein